MDKATEYVAALCHMREGVLVPYDSERFIADSKAEAAARAHKWAAVSLGRRGGLNTVLISCVKYCGNNTSFSNLNRDLDFSGMAAMAAPAGFQTIVL